MECEEGVVESVMALQSLRRIDRVEPKKGRQQRFFQTERSNRWPLRGCDQSVCPSVVSISFSTAESKWKWNN